METPADPAKVATEIAQRYHRDGYASPVRIVDPDEANHRRARLETAETRFGPLHYRSKAHTILTSPFELATQSAVLDIIAAMIGPDILLFNATYIIKEPQTATHVSWHQDLTFWGLSDDDQVSMWLALSPATPTSGCMRMIPDSHKQGRFDHRVMQDDDNVLLQGQTVTGVDESRAVMCPLAPGEASFHHGWTLHASMANNSDERRIGLNVQYLAPHVRQTKHDLDTALLVRGQDAYQHFGTDIAATGDLEPAAVQRQKELEALYVKTVGAA